MNPMTMSARACVADENDELLGGPDDRPWNWPLTEEGKAAARAKADEAGPGWRAVRVRGCSFLFD